MIIYLDESGDCGFTFSRPYRHGGSSRYLSICAAETPKEQSFLLGQIVMKMRKKYNWTTKEKKGNELEPDQQLEFITETTKLLKKEKRIKLHAITVYKQNVQPHITSDCNKLYNYMVGLFLLDRMKLYPDVKLRHDERTIKVESGKSLEDYLQLELWFKKEAETILKTESVESHTNNNILFVDYLTHICWSYYEDKIDIYKNLSGYIHNQTLFFPR